MYPAKLPEADCRPPSGPSAKPEKSLYAEPEDVEKNRRAWVDEWLGALGR